MLINGIDEAFGPNAGSMSQGRAGIRWRSAVHFP